MKTIFNAVLIIGLLLISLSVRSQSVVDVYGPNIPSAKRIEATSYHFWQAYFNGTNWNDEQKAFLEKGARDPMSIKFDQATAFSLFTPDQVKDIFFKVGSFDTGVLKTMYHTDVLAEKAGLLRSLTMAAKGSMWRSRFAELATENPLFTPEQIAQFYHFSQFFNNPTKEGVRAIELEAIAAFGVDTVKKIYGPIGPYSSLGQACKTTGGPSTKTAKIEGHCSCSVGSYFNWSCSGTCNDGTGSCSRTDDGCGFAGLYMCDGGCKVGEMQ